MKEKKRLLGSNAAKNARLPLAEAIAGSDDLDARINKRFKGRHLKERARHFIFILGLSGAYLLGDWLQDGQIDGSLLQTIVPYLGAL